MSDHLNGRRIIVTGASSGIGAAVVASCVRAGARVAGMARRQAALAAIISPLSPDAIAVPGDVTDPAAVDDAVSRCVQWLGGVDGLITVAGLNRAGPFTDGVVEHWDEMIRTNLLATLVVSRAVLPAMIAAGRGDIVTVGSASALHDHSGTSSVYAATKAGVLAWRTALEAEVSGCGIRVMTLSPGTVRTDLADQTPDPELRARRAERFVRIGIDPAVVADQVVHMLSAPPDVIISELVIKPVVTG